MNQRDVPTHSPLVAPEPVSSRAGEIDRAFGVNLIGYLGLDSGLGEAARRLAAGVERANIPLAPVSLDRAASPREAPLTGGEAIRLVFDTNIVCVNADQLPPVAERIGLDRFARCHSIGMWFWETTAFPAAWRESLHFADEIWVASEFVRAVVAPETRKPVLVVPLPLEMPLPPDLSRAELGLPEGFLFLFSFDFGGVIERKNPFGVIDAFTRAFAPGEGPSLVIKSINGNRKEPALTQLREAAAGHPDVHLIDGHVSEDRKNAMVAGCDCYVSLHRSEGLGLTLAEAMAYGKPVIATGYSGNLEFMNDGNSYLIPYELTDIPEGSAYPANGKWADPDIAAAAQSMRHVYENEAERSERGSRARADVLSRFSIDRTATFIDTRLTEVRKQRQAARDPFGEELKLALMRMVTEVRRGVGGSLTASRGWSPNAVVRRLLVRVLWPYLADQQRLNKAVLAALAVLQEARVLDLAPVAEPRPSEPGTAAGGPRGEEAAQIRQFPS